MQVKKAEGLNTALGDTIKTLRIKEGLTQEQLAEKCEASAVYISEIERGIKQPTFHTVFIISLALEIKLSDFVTELESRFEYVA